MQTAAELRALPGATPTIRRRTGFSPNPGRRDAWLMREGRRVPARRLLVTLNATSLHPDVKSNPARGPGPLALAKEQITVKLLPSAPCTARLAVMATLGVLLA